MNNNKTCGECKYYISELKRCNLRKIICNIQTSDIACSCFEQKPIPKPTNGDVIRHGGNRELAHLFANPCPPGVKKKCKGNDRVECENCWFEYLNAPADCVKQNENHDTQTDLCCTDYTQDQEAKENA